MKYTQDMIDLVHECYANLLKVQGTWDAYRRMAGAVGIKTNPLPEVAQASVACVAAAEMLTERKEKIASMVFGKDILQAVILSKDGHRNRKVVVTRPSDKLSAPSISRAAYDALVSILGDGIVTEEQYEIVVTDDFNRIVHTIPTKGN